MTFIFWQNILSMHQSAFINALSKENDVILIVEKEIDAIRQQSGWRRPEFECLQIKVNPSQKEIDNLLIQYRDAIHVMSGLEVTFRSSKLSQKLINGRYKVLCYLEPFNITGAKRYLRTIKYTYLRLKYSKHIWAMLPTGKMGVNQYSKIGFKRIFEWGYFTESLNLKNISKIESHLTPKLLFVGSLDSRKNISFLIEAMSSEALKNVELSIVGDGPLRTTVEGKAASIDTIHYLGVLSNEKVKLLMYEHDILVLPSIFDGWGAVVNEALSVGMRVVCSDCCGASSLLGDKKRGAVFCNGNYQDFINVIMEQLKLGVSSGKDRENIISWCNSNISGEAAAKYFLSICSYMLGNVDIRPTAPWNF